MTIHMTTANSRLVTTDKPKLLIHLPTLRDKKSGQFYFHQLIQPELVLTTSRALGDITGRYLCVCEGEEFEAEAERRIENSTIPDRMRRLVYAIDTYYCDYDDKGNVKIPEHLVEFIGIQPLLFLDEYAYLGQGTVIREVYKGIKLLEIWNKQDWENRRRRFS